MQPAACPTCAGAPGWAPPVSENHPTSCADNTVNNTIPRDFLRITKYHKETRARHHRRWTLRPDSLQATKTLESTQ